MEERKKQGLKTLLFILLSMFFAGFLYAPLVRVVTPELMKELLVVLAISLFGFGFIGFQLEKTKFHKLQRDFLVASLYALFSIIFALLYISGVNSEILLTTFKHASIILFIGGLAYFLIILIVSIFFIDYL